MSSGSLLHRTKARRRLGAAVTALALALATTHESGAAEPTADDQAAARALFDQARALMDEKRYAEACPKLEESQRLSHGTGTLLNLGDCYERSGKTYSAYKTFLRAATSARQTGQTEREKLALVRADVLKRQLSSITVVVPAASAAADLRVYRGDQEIPKESWGVEQPLDPGTYELRATAGGKTWNQTVTLGATADRKSISVPALVEAPPATVPPVAPSPPASGSSPNPPTPTDGKTAGRGPDEGAGRGIPTASYVLGAVALVGFGVSGYFALAAKSKQDESLQHCREQNLCTQQGVDLRDQALKNATTSTIAFGVGAAALGGAAIVYFTSGGSSPKSGRRGRAPSVLGLVAPGHAALGIRGAF